jgi:integrase
MAQRVPKIRLLKEPRRRVRFLRREEADRLIEALPEHMKPIVEFALAIGCRAGEILGLEWSRVDLDRKVTWLDHGTTKSGDGRGIPLNADAMAALEATRGQHPRWCFTFSGKRIHQSSTAWGLAKLRYAHLAPEKLSFVARTHRAAAIQVRRRSATGRKRSKKCYVGATVGALMSDKFLINWCARRNSNPRPPGS